MTKRSVIHDAAKTATRLNGGRESLMLDYEVGVAIQRTIKIAKIDGDYFEDQ
jgi:restriction endonuclease Mrr